MTNEQISDHILTANNVCYYSPQDGVLSYLYLFHILDEFGQDLNVFVPDEYIDDFLRDFPDAR